MASVQLHVRAQTKNTTITTTVYVVADSWKKQLMEKTIISHHPSAKEKHQSTCAPHHNTPIYNRGQLPINGIYTPLQVIASLQGGYLEFDNGVQSDHQVIWLDIPDSILRYNAMPPTVPLHACQLKCQDPWVVKWYTTSLEQGSLTGMITSSPTACCSPTTYQRPTKRAGRHQSDRNVAKTAGQARLPSISSRSSGVVP